MRLTTFSVAATVLLAAGLAIFWPGRNAGPGVAMVSAQVAKRTGEKAAETRAGAGNPDVAQALNRRMDIHYSETPLKDVAAHLTTETGVTFHLKAKKLDEASLSPDTPIDLSVPQHSLEHVSGAHARRAGADLRGKRRADSHHHARRC